MKRRCLTLALFLNPLLAFAGEQGVDFFEKKVRPLLAERCFECHSAEKKVKGGLRLDWREGWAKGGDTGPAITPGHPEKSLLIESIHYGNKDLQMPPKQRLSAEEVEILEQWVQMGAPDPRSEAKVLKKQEGLSVAAGRKFWCYAPVQKSSVPEVNFKEWPRTPIDRYLLAKMEAAGIAPAPDAPLPALVRRLYLNLIGIPPTPEQSESFLSEAARDRFSAIGNLVDSLLASPHFGEAWGRHWLDVARFAESSGGGRTLLFKDAWRYRDYVVEAFNADMPFPQFVKEQLAGDLLTAPAPSEHRRQLTATAFLALGPTNYEEQDKQQLRFDVIDEQIETVGRAFMGQTLGCARCHDHKFDPVPQRDYYALAGIFASTRTLLNYTDNVAHWIAAPLPEEGEREQQLKTQEAAIAALSKKLETAKTEAAAASKKVSEATSSPGKPVAASELQGIVLDDSVAKVVGQWKKSTFVRSFIGAGYLSDDNTGKGEKTITFTPSIPKTATYELRLAYTHAAGRANNVRINILHADGESTVFADETEPPPIDGRFVSLGKFRFEQDGAGYVLISNENTTGFVTVDALQLLEVGAPEKAVEPSAVGKPIPPPKTDSIVRARVNEIEASLKKLTKEGPARDTAMVVADDQTSADTQLRIRGVERQRSESVPRGFLRVTFPTETPPPVFTSSGRLELAEWIASAQNPLTARVQVNRIWNWLFGSGIVRSVDNFGTTGEQPSHPELLDYLANRFIEEGWSWKKLIREIVLSRAWQQSVGLPTDEDPENRLFAHANRRRLSAEQIRDSLLSVSGALDKSVGGSNIAGAGDIDANSSSAQTVEYNYVYKDRRRSVYTPAFRNKRLELFEVFDFGNINQPMGQRNTSTVAPQALYLLNHPFVIEQCKLAAELLQRSGRPADLSLHTAYKQVLARPPSLREKEICLQFLNSTETSSDDRWAQLFQMLFASLDFRYLE